MKQILASVITLGAIICTSGAELARQEIQIHPANTKCHENCSPLCGNLLRVKVEWVHEFNRLPKEKAAFRCSMDKENFYVDTYLVDKDIICDAQSPAVQKLYNVSDSIQIILKSDKHTAVWEFNVTAKGIHNAFLYPGPGALLPELSEKLAVKHEVKVDGTINDNRDTDRSWRVRTTIPLSILRRHGLNFCSSENWTMLVLRNNYGRHLSGRELSTFPQTLRETYDSTRFGILVFPTE